MVPVLAVGKFTSRLFPGPEKEKWSSPEHAESSAWSELTKSYEEASRDVVKWWLQGEGYSLDELLASGLRKETAKDLMFNLMTGVKEGFIDPEFARCLAYALASVVVEQKLNPAQRPTRAWACEYCVFFEGLRDVLLPDLESADEKKRLGDKLGTCGRRGPITMRNVPTGTCIEFAVEKRRHMRVLKQTNEELQLWYLVHRHKASPGEIEQTRKFRMEVKNQLKNKSKERRKRRAADYSLRT